MHQFFHFMMNFLSFDSVFPSVFADFTPPASVSAFRMRIQDANRMRIRNSACTNTSFSFFVSGRNVPGKGEVIMSKVNRGPGMNCHERYRQLIHTTYRV
jgi:hypothetical protein